MRKHGYDLERALKGVAPAGDPLVRFVEMSRDEFAGALTEDTARTHIAAMTLAAQAGSAGLPGLAATRPIRSRRRGMRLVAIAAAAALTFSVVSTGLALAGIVQMPAPARTVLQHIGIHLPDKAGQKHEHPSVPAHTPASPHQAPSVQIGEEHGGERHNSDRAAEGSDRSGEGSSDVRSSNNSGGDSAGSGDGSDSGDPRSIATPESDVGSSDPGSSDPGSSDAGSSDGGGRGSGE